MIVETVNRKNHPAVTSDHWHVIHARSTGDGSFARSIVSEHEDHRSASIAAREIVLSLALEMEARPREGRDQILVRRPNYKSLKTAKRLKRRRK